MDFKLFDFSNFIVPILSIKIATDQFVFETPNAYYVFHYAGGDDGENVDDNDDAGSDQDFAG